MARMNPRSFATQVINSSGNMLLSPPYGGFGFYYNHGSRNSRKIALTFDDGPNKPSTELLLDAMDTLHVKGTFFCIGMQVQYHPDLLQRLDAAGHVVGNHSMLHSRKAGLMPTGGEHIDASEREIARIIGRRPALYRPPWGWLTPWEARRLTARGYAIIGWDVYTYDWKLPEIDGGQIADGICHDVQPGSIILLHDSHGIMPTCTKSEMVRAVQQLVPKLRAAGYEFVTIPELLHIPAYLPL